VIEERDLLIARLLEGDLTAEEDRRARALLEGDPAFRREAAGLVRTGRLLRYMSYLKAEQPDLAVGVAKRLEFEEKHETGRFAEAVGRRLDRPVSRRASHRAAATSRRGSRRTGHAYARVGLRWRYAAVLGAAAAAMLAAGLYFAHRQPPVVSPGTAWQAEVASVNGTVDVVRAGKRSRAAAGQQLRPGDELQTGRGARAALHLADGTTVELNELTVLPLRGDDHALQLQVSGGEVYVLATRQNAGRPLVLNAGRRDQAEVFGTEFEFSCPGAETSLKVVSGSVRFGLGDAAVAVAGGYASRVEPEGPPAAPQPFDLSQVAMWRAGRTPPPAVVLAPPPPPEAPPPPPAPVAKPLAVSAVENLPKEILLAADPPGVPLVFGIGAAPEHGRLSGTPPQVVYTPDKDYSGPDSFTFTASRPDGPASTAKVSITITHVNRPPVALIAAQPAKGFAPLAVRFDASDSSDADGKIVGYLWKFGDGWTDQRVAADHTYAAPGVYVAELTVTDDQQAASSTKATITVERDPDIIAAPTNLDGHRGGRPVAFILTWKDNSDNEEGFHVERAETVADNVDFAKLQFQRLATVGPNVTQAKVQLTPTPNKKSTFYFRVLAFNTKTGRVSPYAIWAVTWDPSLPDGTLNWPPPAATK
jgi:ferric-dicitrate binding protein FerR (iron transport regulator)/PKD repeat protein